SGAPVDEAEIYDRFRDEVVARSGIRRFNDDSNMIDCGSNDVRTVFLTSEQTFTVDTKAEAEDYVLADPSHTTIWEENGTWHVTKSAGSPVQVPARATLTRTVGGQIPEDFDPAQWGIPASMVEALDRIAVWNLVTAVDAFITSGFSPAELLQAVHPADVSSTQGTGIGGMESLRHVFLSRFLGEDRPQDILQEALPNVVAAHTMQSFIGGYGQMIHSVGACATAAVSIEEAVDKIRLGKSDFVVAGGIDDISVESLTGFGNMNATAESAALEARGITPRHFSRAGDRRRAGFLEAAGGGTLLVTRGDIAADLGLPVQAVIAFARSFADGAHTSIPAPGLGALAAARGGRNSALARALEDLGLSADDIAVVSKHDTSTRANDPNEAELHSRLSAALGRSAGNPLYVVSQKTLTGHAKGGAALFQAAGLIDIFRRQELPANRALDCLDPEMAQWMPLLWLRQPLDMSASPVRAGVLTSLGFGHIAAMVVLVHPAAFEAALRVERGDAALAQWRERAQMRLEEGRRHLEQGMIGHAKLFVPIEGRRLPATDTHEAEVALLLDPSARLGADGTYASTASDSQEAQN
ncbi:MAG: type I polyketide synthase, partial [Trueperella pyogenes]|nr:type I polyketide synthase [Trueperella pyogenes]